jgi:hypothetical protein
MAWKTEIPDEKYNPAIVQWEILAISYAKTTHQGYAEYLASGWEPYAAVTYGDTVIHYLRRKAQVRLDRRF